MQKVILDARSNPRHCPKRTSFCKWKSSILPSSVSELGRPPQVGDCIGSLQLYLTRCLGSNKMFNVFFQVASKITVNETEVSPRNPNLLCAVQMLDLSVIDAPHGRPEFEAKSPTLFLKNNLQVSNPKAWQDMVIT